MVLTVDSQMFADAQIQGVTLHPLVGAYELRFGLLIICAAVTDGERCRAVIDGARVSVGTGGGDRDDLGFARTDARLEVASGPHQLRTTPTLSLPLQPGQLAAIERLRGAGDLHFDLGVTGTGSGRTGESAIHEVLRCDVPRSKWIGKLRSAKARDILLLEVPLPFPERLNRWSNISDELRRAESRLRNGDYLGCVSACRVVVEELVAQMSGGAKRPGRSPEQVPAKPRDMSKSDREGAMLEALRRYTHQAHHGPSEGGEVNYSRADARHILTLTASFVAHARTE
ncbi:MAG: hypothetical protein F4213_17955 [Boseongicola sp. SB0677_bin_26]|nr:hypothetical protein [Boseongicola sp. SB0665_bin_10]MYG27877.1 hypothetical protein [Boseongicola sp. SB0677_bin_26]